MRILTFLFIALHCTAVLNAEETSKPRPTPLTRPLMKQYLEDMKGRTPRISLPELSEQEKAALGERNSSYESRLKALYLSECDFRGSLGSRPAGGQLPSDPAKAQALLQQNEPGMTLDYRFKTSLFWIVSRTNNCQYCLGHQESKLLRAGMTEDEIAGLDGDWSEFTPKEQAAFRLARKLTLEPHRLTGTDIDEAKKHFTEMQVLEMVLSVAGNNCINRWKEGAGVPQSSGGGNFGRPAEAQGSSEQHSYLTATSDKFKTRTTLVAPIVASELLSGGLSPTVARRPELEPRQLVEKRLAECRRRTARLPLVEEGKAREVLGDDAPEGSLPQWMRLLANFPTSGKRLVSNHLTTAAKGNLTPLLKAQVSWIIARQDRAWYAAAEAKARLQELGQTEDQIYALDGDWQSFSEADRAMFTVAKNLAASPVVLTDNEVALALKHTSPRDVVQMINYTTNRVWFNRITEAAGLQIEN